MGREALPRSSGEAGRAMAERERESVSARPSWDPDLVPPSRQGVGGVPSAKGPVVMLVLARGAGSRPPPRSPWTCWKTHVPMY